MFFLLATAPRAISPVHIILLIVVVVLAVITPFLVRRGRRRPPAQLPEEPRPQISREALGVQQAADEALVQLLETGRQIQAQIDTKIRVLNKLIKDADTQADRLQSLIEAVEDEPAPPEESTTVTEPKRTKSGRWVSDIHARIEALKDQGRSPAEIARATRLSVQEVNLVLHLLAEKS